ncbi:MAG: hypothetical protein O3B24_07910, partial [Verrucomicrobia bacterium]|nr:hypothetical protein [Verrucomicrobiota bacterium]
MRGCMRMISVVALWAAVTVGAVAAPVNKSLLGGLAVKGTDVVAYFTEGQAVAGNAAYTHAWQAATWRFASAAH